MQTSRSSFFPKCKCHDILAAGETTLKRIRFGTIHADFITFDETLDAIEQLVSSGHGGTVLTPNVDHVVQAEHSNELRSAYERAALSLVDGMPLVWMSTLLGHPLPEKISGSDLVRPLMSRAASSGMSVYFLGSAPGVGDEAGKILRKEMPTLQIVGIDSPPLGFDKNPALERETMEKVAAANPDLVLVALGCPKQELLMDRWFERMAPAVMLGIGASLDFISGRVKRSPQWMSRWGIEWVYRLSRDPKRMAKRYLIQDAAIIPIFLQMLRCPKHKRIFFREDTKA